MALFSEHFNCIVGITVVIFSASHLLFGNIMLLLSGSSWSESHKEEVETALHYGVDRNGIIR